MNNLIKSFYAVLTAPTQAPQEKYTEDVMEEYVVSTEGERVGLFSELFGSLTFRNHSLSV